MFRCGLVQWLPSSCSLQQHDMCVRIETAPRSRPLDWNSERRSVWPPITSQLTHVSAFCPQIRRGGPEFRCLELTIDYEIQPNAHHFKSSLNER